MRYDELMSKLFGFSVPTYYNWKKEKRAIIDLIEQSFSTQQIESFLEFENFLCEPKMLIEENSKKALKFIDIIGITSIEESHSFEFGEKFLNVLVYIAKTWDFVDEANPASIKKYMQRYFDDYRNLYNVNSWDLEHYTSYIDDLKFEDDINFDSLFHHDFKELIYYAINYEIKYFNFVLVFYLKFVYFNEKEKVNEIYEKIKPIYQNKKNNLYYDNMWYQEEKDVILIFNYELFKELVLAN